MNLESNNPSDLLQQSTILANNNNHEEAVALAHAGLQLNPAKDVKIALLERISISGFYSETRKIEGRAACEILANDREVPWFTRNLARQNSTYYAQSSTELMPSTIIKEVDFIPKYDYAPMNPSITTHNGMIYMIQRSVNYRIRPDGSYDMRGDCAIRTTNYLLQLDDNLNVITSDEILPPQDLPEPLYGLVIGWEDCRLFFWNDEPWCTATVRELNPDGYCEIVMSRIGTDASGKKRFCDYKVIKPTFCPRQHEKNWMPIVTKDDLYFLYSSDPVRLIDQNGNLVASKVSHFASDSYRGGGNLVPFGEGWLGLIHESHNMPNGPRRYMHRFVWYNAIGKLCKKSPAFYLKQLGIEFSAGLAVHPSRPEVIASFGIHDRTSWLATFKITEIEQILQFASKQDEKFWYDLQTTIWMANETNGVLKTRDNRTKMHKLQGNIEPCRDHDWSDHLAQWHTYLNIDQNENILNIDNQNPSTYENNLKSIGYQNVTTVDSTTLTGFDANQFAFVNCNFMIDKVNNLDAWIQDLARILKPSGRAFFTACYWHGYVHVTPDDNCKIFMPFEIENIVKIASKYNMFTESKINLQCFEKTVSAHGREYTLINFMMVKK